MRGSLTFKYIIKVVVIATAIIWILEYWKG